MDGEPAGGTIDTRQGELFAVGRSLLDQFIGDEFAAKAEVGEDHARIFPGVECDDLLRDVAAGGDSCGGRQRVACRQYFAA